MRRTLNEIYRKAAEEFAHRVVSALGEQVDSLVLYGSVARGEAKRYSDVDILVVSRDPRVVREVLSQIRGDLTYERNFAFLISLVHFSRAEFYRLIQLGSPFIWEVINEGVILHDNQTFARVREKGVAVS